MVLRYDEKVTRKYMYILLLLHLLLGSDASNGVRRRNKCDLTRNGIVMPYRRCIMDLSTFKEKVDGVLWRSFYFGSTIAEEFLFFKGENRFTLTSNDMTLITEFSGEMSNGTCTGGGSEEKAISNKAEFLSATYSVFVSSDPDTYLLSIHCASTQPLRRCPVEDAYVNFMVKEPRPDSLPLQLAVKDLYRAFCLTFDATPGDFRFVFMFGENHYLLNLSNELWENDRIIFPRSFINTIIQDVSKSITTYDENSKMLFYACSNRIARDDKTRTKHLNFT